MIAKAVFAYLEPYLPYQVVYGISMVAFFFERLILPKIYQVYANASLDPKTLVPFAVSAIALYLSIVSIYHAFKAAFKTVWFLIKWSVVIVVVWGVLAVLNDLRDRSDGGIKSAGYLFETYQSSLNSWWKTASWSSMNLADHLGFDPLQILLGHGILGAFEPILHHFQSQTAQASSSFFNPQDRFTSQPTRSDPRNTFDRTKSRSGPSDDPTLNFAQLAHQFWVQSVRTPIESIIKQSKSQRSQAQAGSGTYTR